MENPGNQIEDIRPLACGVYSKTSKTLQERRKQINNKVHQKYEARVADIAAIPVASCCHEELGGSSNEKGASLKITDRSPSPPMNLNVDLMRSDRVTVIRNAHLSERMRKLEENKNAQKEYIINSALEDSSDISKIDLCKFGAPCLDQDDDWKMNVKIHHGGTILRCAMGMNDSFSTLTSWLETKTGLRGNRFAIIFNNRALTPTETPASIGLCITDILDFIPLGNSVPDIINDEVHNDDTLIKVFLKTKNFREKLEFQICKHDKMSKLVQDYAIKFNQDIGNLQLRFDGETLDLESTAAEQDLEDGFQIDIIAKN